MSMRKRLAITSVSAIAVCLAGSPARAQDSEPGTVQELIVTAQKREQIAQEVPLSLSVVDSRAIQRQGAQSLTDVQSLVPGIQLVNTNGVGTTQAVSRGVTTVAVTAFEATAAVGLYLDETPVSAFTSRFPDLAMSDVERIEFLRGPQGTLFGEGSMAGTIRVITNKPNAQRFSGGVYGRAYDVDGGEAGGSLFGVINLPIREDRLALRVSGQRRVDAGWIDVPVLRAKDINENRQTDLRAALRFTPSEQLTIDLAQTYHKHAQVSSHQTKPGIYDPTASVPGAGVPSRRDIDQTTTNLTELTVNYDFGPVTFVSASGYFKLDTDNPRDFGPVAPLFFGPGIAGSAYQDNDRSTTSFSQELRLVSNGENKLNWTVGAFYRRMERSQSTLFDFNLTRFGVPVLPRYGSADTDSESEAYAIFGEFDYHFTDRLWIALGGRYSSDDRNIVLRQHTTSAAFGTVAGTVLKANAEDSAFSPNVQINYKPDEDVLLFARIAKGFRAGGTNQNAAQTPTIPMAYGPESLWSFEVGAKTDPTPWLRLNGYAFFNRWTDIQLNFSTPNRSFTFVSNAGGADAYGVEFEAQLRPADGLTIDANLAYTHAELVEAVIDPARTLVVSKGNRIPYVPRWAVGVAAHYETEFLGKTLFLHGDYRYRTKTMSDPANTPLLESTDLHNLNIRAAIGDENWQIGVFSENVLNREDTQSAEYVVFVPVRQYVRPRTIGVELRRTF